MGGVTPVPTGTRSVACAIALSTGQAKGDSPSGHQGWKWSDEPTASKPAASAAIPWARREEPGNCSVERLIQMGGMPTQYPLRRHRRHDDEAGGPTPSRSS